MPKIQTNFNDVPDEYLPVPAGVYTCEINEAPKIEAVKSDPSKTKLTVVLTVVSGPEGAEQANLKGRKLFDTIPMSRKTSIKRLALSAGLNPGSDGLDTEELVGRTVRVMTKMDEYQGEMRAKVKDYIVTKA